MSAQPELPHLEAQLEVRLADLMASTDREIEALRRTKHQVESKISALTRKRRVWEATLQAVTPPQVGGPTLRLITKEPPKPRAVAAFLSEHRGREFRLREIKEALVARGWMQDDPRSVHALEVAVRSLAARGEIKQPPGRRGIYLMPVEET